MSISPVIIGDATLYRGDCMDILPTLGKVDAVITDPPYLISASGGGIGGQRQYLTDIRDHIDAGFDFLMLQNFKNWFCFCGKSQLLDLIGQAEKQGLRWQILTWNKTNPTPLSNNNYLPDTEYMVHAFESHHYESKTRFVVGQVVRSGYDHPTVKPQYVMQKAVKSASHQSDTVLDCFMGTGSTGVAAIQLGRKFIGIEREPKYFDIACQRIEQAVAQGHLFATEPVCKPEQLRLEAA
jgi:site-specific DNA-methyltransferase (adenine-specific)